MKLSKIYVPTFGDLQFSRRQLIKELEKDPVIQKTFEQYPEKRFWWNPFFSPVKQYLREMVANPSPITVIPFNYILKFLWNRIFHGIEVNGLKENQAKYEGKSIIYIPCHRSHLDYGLLSYILLQHKLPLPHIVAGNNLNMFLIGRLLRRGGAVFIKRVFKGRPLYSSVFITYLKYLLDHKLPLEFFIEGGRSRTGKNLPPKTGFLSMLVQYLEENPKVDLHLVPVSNVYDRVMEESTYVKELGGLPKREESLGGLLKAYKLLNVNYGRVYVTFAPPVSLRQLMNDYQKSNQDRQQILYSIGMDVMDQINQHCTTSATPIISTVLLSESRQGFRKAELVEKGNFLIQLYRVMHPRPNETLLETKDGLDGVINFMFQSGSVGCLPDHQGDIYFFKYQNKLRLNIYKNIIIHHFVIPSIVTLKLQHEPQTLESLLTHIQYFDHLFRYEFMFPRSYDFSVAVKTILEFFISTQLVLADQGVFHPNPDKKEELQMLARILLPFREAFYVAIYTITHMKVPFPVPPKELVKQMQQTFLKMHLLGEIESAEANVIVTYQNIIRFLTEENYLKSVEREEGKSQVTQGNSFHQLDQIEEKLF